MKYVYTYTILVLIFFCYNVYLHETVHQQIFEQYDISSKQDWISELPFRVVTIPEKNCPTETCISLQMQNDIVGYNLSYISDILILMGFILVYYVETKEMREELEQDIRIKEIEIWNQKNGIN